MKKITYLLASLTLLFVLIASNGFFGVSHAEKVFAGTDPQLTLKSALNTVKVERSEDISSLPAASLSIEAARGESDGAQFIILSEEEREYTLSASALSGPGGASIPAGSIELYVQIYGQAKQNLTSFPVGWYPDALIPFRYIRDKGENKLTPGQNQGIWVDVAVPEDAAAGTYAGTVTVQTDEYSTEIPLSLTVYDFTMNPVPSMKTVYLIWTDWLIFGELDNTNEMYKTYYDEMLKYNLQAQDLPARIGDIEGYKAAVREYYDKINAYAIPYQLENSTTLDWNLMRKYLVALMDISLEDNKNYFDKAYYAFDKLYDEADQVPSRQENIWPSVNGTNDLASQIVDEYVASGKISDEDHWAARGIKSVRHLLVSSYMEEFANPNLFFCPGYDDYYSTDGINFNRELAESGTEMFSYGALAWWPHSSTVIDDYLITARDIYWSRFEYGVTGDLFWCVNGYPDWSRWVGGANGGYDVVDDLYTTYTRDGYSDGDGWLFYPGRPYGSDKPFPSLRLMARRDGIDDHDYITMLDDRYTAMGLEGAETVTSLIGSQIYSLGVSKLNFSGLQTARRALADLIVMADGGAEFAVNDLQRKTDGLTYDFRAAAGTRVFVNGSELSSSDQTGRVFSGELAYPSDGVLRIRTKKDGIEQSVELIVGKTPVEVAGFESSEEAENVSFNAAGSRASVSSDIALKGVSSLRMEFAPVSGRCEARIAFSGGLENTEALLFALYNDSDADITVYIGVRNSGGIPYGIDIVTLKAGQWTQIRLEQFKTVSTDAERLAAIESLTISVPASEETTVLRMDGFYRVDR